MTIYAFVDLLTYLEPLLCGVLLVFLIRSGDSRKYRSLVALLGVKLTSSLICVPLLHLGRTALGPVLAYRLYFLVYWPSYVAEAILSLYIVYSIFKLAMEPLQGLQKLGTLVFRWAAAISGAISLGMAMGPRLGSGIGFVLGLVGQLQQTTSILTLCLLIFVCFAIRPMGLSVRSRSFGISFGLGIVAAVYLIEAAWLAHNASLYTTMNLINGLADILTLMVWSAYFAFPEPKRRIIVLPTTSPFLRWNQISQALGDEPGFVAIGGIPPEIFAPAEIEVMRRASTKMSLVDGSGVDPGEALPSVPSLRSMTA